MSNRVGGKKFFEKSLSGLVRTGAILSQMIIEKI